jgi:hypothetical protein
MKVTFIAHRTNTLDLLHTVPKNFGIELDLRDDGDKVSIVHDPFSKGILFEKYLNDYNHEIIILNTKSEGIEYKILELLYERRIENFFFLDSTIPTIVNLSEICNKKIASRLSIYEPIESSRLLKSLCNWVWVDYIDGIQIKKHDFLELKNLGYKICIVSPDLYGRDSEINSFAKFLLSNSLIPDAICGKFDRFPIWQRYINFN